MKRFAVIFFGLLILAALAGCGGKKAPAAAGGTAAEGPGKIVFVNSGLGDMSFNDSGAAGIRALERDYGFKTQVLEVGEDLSKYESFVREAAGDPEVGYVLASGTFREAIESAAASFPDKRFVIFDVGRDTPVAYNNILYVVYAQNEGSYLVGMVAAEISKSGVIGAVGGVENPVICDFITGYIEGARAHKPDIKVATGWVGNWIDTAAMLELCMSQHNTSAVDVFFPVAGAAGIGAFDAAIALNRGIWTIGVDSDQYEALRQSGNTTMANVIYTSMLKEVGNTFISVFSDLKEGREYWGTVRTLGVKEKAVGYADNDYFRANVDPAFLQKLESARDKIASGEIKVRSYFDFPNGMSDYNAFVNSVKP
ncbi:MAG: BMP family ABC transporter substrate-binding protein [Treponema sp.]|jgi:basic membrane protein A|nr:BMP family ABC transporter substrate-binding protein [Treponema sp.]